jgi:hypothetical protein
VRFNDVDSGVLGTIWESAAATLYLEQAASRGAAVCA